MPITLSPETLRRRADLLIHLSQVSQSKGEKRPALTEDDLDEEYVALCIENMRKSAERAGKPAPSDEMVVELLLMQAEDKREDELLSVRLKAMAKTWNQFARRAEEITQEEAQLTELDGDLIKEAQGQDWYEDAHEGFYDSLAAARNDDRD